MSLLTSALSACGRLLPGTQANRLLVLIYHRVHRAADPMCPVEVDAERFDWQMALLRSHCCPLSLAEGVERLKRGDLPPRAVAVTFDDGYMDNATVALPILQKHGILATFFIAPGFLDGGRMWNDSIIETVRRVPGDTVDTGAIGLGVLPLPSSSSRARAAEQIIKAVKHRSKELRAALVDELCARGSVDLPHDLMMTSEQVKDLVAAGMEVGAHTMTHPILRTLTDYEVRREIQESRAVLERIIQRPVRSFAYPNGRPVEDYTERDRAIVESLGFDYAPSTRFGVATIQTDVLQLPRFTPWDATPSRWLARLLATYQSPI